MSHHIGGLSHHHIGISSHSRGSSSSSSTPIWKSPAQLLYENHIQEVEARISPPYCPFTFLLRFGFFLSFVTLPLTGAMIGTPWLIADSGINSLQNKTWDGRTSNCVAKYGGRRVAGYLTLFHWEDCNDGLFNECSDYVTWSFCGDSFSESADGDALQSIQSSSLDNKSKSAITLSAVLSILTLFSIVILLVRNCLASGSRLSMRNRKDPFYIKFVMITRFQLVIHIVFIASALGSFFNTIPSHFRSFFTEDSSFIGTSFITRIYYSEETIAAPGQALGLAHCVLSGVSFILYTLYSFNIESWTASHPIGELEPEPPQPTEAERNAAMSLAVSQAHALKAAQLMLMLQALQEGGPTVVVDSGAIQSVIAQLVATEAEYASAFAPKSTSTMITENIPVNDVSTTNSSSSGSIIAAPRVSTPLDFQIALNRLSPESRVYLAAEAQRLGMEIPSVTILPTATTLTGVSTLNTPEYIVPSQLVSGAYPYYPSQPQVYPSPFGMEVGERREGNPVESGVEGINSRPQPSLDNSRVNLGISGHAVFDQTLGYHVFVPNRR